MIRCGITQDGMILLAVLKKFGLNHHSLYENRSTQTN